MSFFRKWNPLGMLVWVIGAVSTVMAAPKPAPTPDIVDVLVIDAGHGGKDAGCVGPGKTREKDVALSVALKFGKLVQEKYKDVKVYYTRKDDTFIELWKRGQIANDHHADLFVSIHCNAAKNASARGTETWIRGSQKDDANLAEVQRENAVVMQEQNHEQNYSQSWMDLLTATVQQDAGFENSIYFSQELQRLYTSRLVSSPDRGIKQGPFYVLWKSARPSVLTEIGFLSHPEEEKFLASEQGQDMVANCLLAAFAKYKARIDSRSGLAVEVDSEPAIEPAIEPAGEFIPSPKEILTAPKQEPEPTPVERVESPEPETVNPDGPAQAADAKQIVYKVQIVASKNRVDLVPANFKGLNRLSRSFDPNRQLYRYYYGQTASYSEIQQALGEAKKAGYSGAFVTAFEDGVSIDVKEALGKQRQ